MNVLILAKDSHLGGLTTCCGNLAQGLIQHLKDNVVIGMNNGEGARKLAKDYKVEYLSFGGKNPLAMLKTYKQIGKLIKENEIDVIHAQNRIPALFAAVYCFFNRKVNYIWANHLVPVPSGFVHRLLSRYGYCAVSEGIAGKVMLVRDLHIPENKVRIVNLGVDLSKFVKTSVDEQESLKEQFGIKEGEKVILLYGRLCENKGHLFLMDALGKVKNRNFKLIFPGKDDEFKRLVDEKANKYGLTDNIIYPGFVNGPACLSICDLMVLPSRKEGFPQACVEAYAMGVPVIRTKNGGYEDTQDMCFGVDFGDVDALTELLQNFFDNPEIYSERAKVALQKVGRLSIERMAEEYHAIYQEAIDARKK